MLGGQWGTNFIGLMNLSGIHRLRFSGRDFVLDGLTFEPTDIPEPVLLNNKFARAAPPTTQFNPTPCAAGTVATFSIGARFVNVSQDALENLFLKINTLTGGNVLCNADGGSGGVGSTLTILLQGDLNDGVLGPGESFTVQFDIGLAGFRRFTFFVDVFGNIN